MHALRAAYPRQLVKLFRLVIDKYIPLLQALAGGGEGADKGAEERQAISVLQSWLEDALGKDTSVLAPPAEVEMEVFKTPDDTSDAKNDDW